MQYIKEYANQTSYDNNPMVGPGVALINDVKGIKYITDLIEFTIDGKYHKGYGYWYYWIDSPHNSLGLTKKTGSNGNYIVLETSNGIYYLNKKSGSTLTQVKAGTQSIVPNGGTPSIENGDTIISNGTYVLKLDETTSTSAPIQ